MFDNIDLVMLEEMADKCESYAIAAEDIGEKVKHSSAAKMLRQAICLLSGEGL